MIYFLCAFNNYVHLIIYFMFIDVKVSNPLVLELQTVVNFHMGAET